MTVSNNLAPYVSVSFWRARSIGVELVNYAGEATFAIVEMPGVAPQQYELPAQADKFEAFLAGVSAAYALGHRDRMNRVRDAIGVDVIDQMPRKAARECRT